MALLDGLKNLRDSFANVGNTPPNPNPATTKPPVDKAPQGASGRAHFDGFIQWDEFNPEWIGVKGLELADRMWRTDADVKRDTLATWSPITTASWEIAPYGGDKATKKDKEAAALCRHALFNYMTPNLMTHLAEVGPILIRSGFVDFEQIWKSTEWKGKKVVLPKKLDLRLPRTIWKFYQDDDGDLTGIVQFLPNAANVYISATELIHYRLQAEGDNWTGTSMYRHAWKHFYIKEKLEKLDAIGQERKAVGVPVVYPPTGASEDTKKNVETILANLHTNEVGFIIMPGPKARTGVEASIGWEIDIITFDSSSSSGIRESIDQQTLKIAGAFIADFLELGHHQVGARATADVQEDPFMTAVKALGELIVEPLNKLCERIAMLNIPGLEGAPKLTMSLHDEASLSELSTYAQQLWASELLTPGPELEDYFRERADLPPADPEIRQETQQVNRAKREMALNGGGVSESEQTGEGKTGAPPVPLPPAGGTNVNGGTPTRSASKAAELGSGRNKPTTNLAPPDADRSNSPGSPKDPHNVNNGPSKPSKQSLILEDDTGIKVWYDDARPAPAGWVRAVDNKEAETLLQRSDVAAVSLDYDMKDPKGPNGLDLVRWMVRTKHVPPVVKIHSANPDGTEAMEAALRESGAHVHLAGANLTPASRLQLDDAPAPWHEQLLSQASLKEALDGARASMENATKPAAYKLASMMAARGRSGRKIAVAAPPADLVKAFESEMERLYDIGHKTVADELEAQHKAMGRAKPPKMLDDSNAPEEEEDKPKPVTKRRNRIKRRAAIAAEHVNNEIAREVERAVLAGEREPLALQRKAETAAQRAIRKEALTNASPSINDGRRDAAMAATAYLAKQAVSEGEAEPSSLRTSTVAPEELRGIYTAVLDNRTCDPCELADDGVEREPEDPALETPNPECSGGELCRCTVVWVLSGAQEAMNS